MPVKIHGFTLPDSMEICNSGEKCEVSKDGCRYVLKLDRSSPYPASTDSISEIRYRERLEKCLRFEEKRKKINEALRQADGGDRILGYAYDVFVCKEKRYPGVIEAVPMIEGSIPWQSITGEENRGWNYQACLCFAQAVERVHGAGILHLDLKPANIVFTCDQAGILHGTLIDFDLSCFEGTFDKHSVGTVGYLAPEEIMLVNAEEDGEIAGWQKMIGKHTDVFALGACFSALLTGSPPSGWETVGPDQYLISWPRQKVREPFLRELTDAMMAYDFRLRPEIDAVVESLRCRSLIRKPDSCILWPEHAGKLRVNPSRAGLIRRITKETFNGENGYAVQFRSGAYIHYSYGQILDAGILTAAQ